MSRTLVRSAIRWTTARPWLAAVLGVPLLAALPSQSALYMPRSFRLAVARGTRTTDGRPGASYWQNRARYHITLTVAPPNRSIRGSEKITYVNESPDTLRRVAFRLFMNVHQPEAPRAGGARASYLTTGVHVDSLAVNGTTEQWPDDSRHFTWVPVPLPSALAPHDSVRFDVGWHYDLAPAGGTREGIIDSTTYYLAYFYPRVSVYDDVDGWDTMDFTGTQEFYSDFNDYDVTVNVPASTIVWGTGTLTNAASVLQPEYLRRFQASLTSDETIPIASVGELARHAVTQQNATNGWHFTARNVPDVAFGLSDHYDWDGASVLVDDSAHRRASVQAAYNDSAADFHHMVRYARHALDFLSHQWPGVPYPYEKTTVFQGGAGMEYPMMVNDESYPDTSFSAIVAEHELAHTYFPFYMGIDETRYGFMDEGWATTFEYLFEQPLLGAKGATTLYQRFRIAGWIHDSSATQDLPIITPGDLLRGSALGNNEYGKPSLGYLAVKELLGDAMFRKCLHAYVERWHGKHPQPWDFFYTFNAVSGRNLNWFWNNWYFGNNYIDLAVHSVTRARGGYAVVVDNVGGMDAPFDLALQYSDGSTQTVHETPAVWAAGEKAGRVTIATTKRLRSLAIDGGIFMDADTTNNRWTAR